ECPDAAEPGAAVCADRRGAARLPVVQRPSGAGVHGRLGLTGAWRDARGHGPDHGPDPDPADRRPRVRARDAVGRGPGHVLQAHGRQTDLPDEPAAPPLRAGGLGRGEDHPPLLDRGHHRRAHRRDAVPGLDPRAEMTVMTADRIDTGATIDPGSLTPGSLADGVFRGRSVSVLGFARSGIALARFLADAGAEVSVYDGRPAGELDRAIAALEDRPVRLLLGPDVDPAAALEG